MQTHRFLCIKNAEEATFPRECSLLTIENYENFEMLEFQVESNAEHAVGAGVAVLLIACLSGSSHIASAVEGLHITQVDACAARYV